MSLDYVISEEIFRSRKRIIFRATLEKGARAAIVKTLNAEHPSDTDIASLRREFDIIRSLDDDGIVSAIDFAIDRGRPALVLEDIGGKTLKKCIESEELDLARTLGIVCKLAKAVAVIHREQLIHKDINPKNVIVNLETDQVQLIDFSISSRLPKEVQKTNHPGFLEGTLAYISPEQTSRMNRSVDYRTDFYSLGVTFYEMLTARLPFPVRDPMELVHCHIAKEPPPPSTLNRGIPDAVSNVVMKMLAKKAEDRYRSALGINADVEHCLAQLNSSTAMVGFTPGAHDIQDRFQVPQKLYGREEEIETLLAGFDRVSRGATQMLLVSGYSGIGKSALIHEIDKPIVDKRGYFISGKFDQLQRTVPYSAIVAALRDLVRQLLTESEERLAKWSARLSSAVGVNGRVITDVIPEVALVIGDQPPVTELDPRQAENRFKLVFQNFIRVFCQLEHPLVMFLDDLQWADSASLKLIDLIMLDQQTRCLYLLGAYRDNEVDGNHPLITTLDSLRSAAANVEEIVLTPLDSKHVGQLISESFRRDDVGVNELTDSVLRKTGGNPFFIRQFLKALYQEELIYFDAESVSWKWRIADIESSDITNNVVDLMVRKLNRLAPSLGDVLRLAACIGNRFDLESLAIISEHSPVDTARALWPAIQDGLVLPTSRFEAQVSGLDVGMIVDDAKKVTFRFLHDRVQQAAYTLIEEAQKKLVHLKIGTLLLGNLSEDEKGERLFELVDHLNMGRELMTETDDLLGLANLNLRAGIKAKEATAYDAARDYLRMGIESLVSNAWASNYDVSFALHKSLAETEYLRGRFEASEDIIGEILRRAQSSVERAEAHNILVVQQTLNGEYERAIASGVRALAELGIDLPSEELKAVLETELAEADKALAGRSVGSLLELEEVTRADLKIAFKLLASVMVLCYIADPDLCRVSTLRMVKISLEFGHTPDSVFGYAFYGLVLSSVVKNYQSAWEFGQLAIDLSEKFSSATQKCKATHVFAAFINHWSRPLGHMLELNDIGFDAGLESGELQFAGYHRYNRALCLFYMGRSLNLLLPELDQLAEFSRKTRNQHATDPITATQLVARRLTGNTSANASVGNANLDDDDFQRDLIERSALPALTHYNVLKAFVLYLDEEYDDALRCIETSKTTLSFVSGHFSTAAHPFYHALILAALYPRVSEERQRDFREVLQRNHEQLERWAERCRENFQHKALLVGAEIARLEGKRWEACELYDRAILAAKENEFIHEEALANELAGKLHEQGSRDFIARAYLIEARDLYRDWGATTKVRGLEKRYRRYLSETPVEPVTSTVSTMTHDLSTGTGTKTLDFEAVVKAAQAISSEIVLDALPDKLIGIVIENAGAQRGSLLLAKGERLFVEASASVENEEMVVNRASPAELDRDYLDLPQSIINLAKRTRDSVVLEDASADARFAGDAYVRRVWPKSILCMPIIDKGELLGILYLENNLVDGAFKPERLEVMQVLASQSAISLQNARFYDDLRRALGEVELLKSELEMRVRGRTSELSRANDLLEIKNQELARRTAEIEAVNRELESFAYAVSHDLRSPLRGISGFSRMLAEDHAGGLDDAGLHYVDVVQKECTRMSQIIEDLLGLATVSGGRVEFDDVDLSEIASSIVGDLERRYPNRRVKIHIAPSLLVRGDGRLLKIALENLVGNAWKFTSRNPQATIELGKLDRGDATTFFVRDDGIGFDNAQASKLFAPLHRLHSDEEFEGTGLGLATVRRIIERHGGSVRAEGEVGKGAMFYFSLSE